VQCFQERLWFATFLLSQITPQLFNSHRTHRPGISKTSLISSQFLVFYGSNRLCHSELLLKDYRKLFLEDKMGAMNAKIASQLKRMLSGNRRRMTAKGLVSVSLKIIPLTIRLHEPKDFVRGMFVKGREELPCPPVHSSAFSSLFGPSLSTTSHENPLNPSIKNFQSKPRFNVFSVGKSLKAELKLKQKTRLRPTRAAKLPLALRAGLGLSSAPDFWPGTVTNSRFTS
jgi:hypothetical protein